MIFELSVVFLRERAGFVAYSPALDLSTSGRTLAVAKKRFEEAAVLFFEALGEMGTTEEALKELGWQKRKNSWLPPAVISKEDHSVSVPVYA